MKVRRLPALAAAVLLLALCLLANLSLGETTLPPAEIIAALTAFDDSRQAHYIVLYQRLPRALIALFTGAATAMSGAVLQGLLRNPLAAPSLLGINAGAALFVLGGVMLFDLTQGWQGVAALAGGAAGFLGCVLVARMVGLRNDPRKLALILSGAVVSMFCSGMSQAILLSDPARRADFLGWLNGNINHAYFPRLMDFWWIGALGMAVMLALSRPLSLLALGPAKAASLGVDVARVTALAYAAAVLASAAAVAVCGPVGFVGLVVPHLVRPFTGAGFGALLPGCFLVGAAFCLLADIVARKAFAPHVLHSGVVMELLGGLVFILIVRRFYLSGSERAAP